MAKDVGKSMLWLVRIEKLGKRLIVADTIGDLIETVDALAPGAKISELAEQDEVFGDKKVLK